MPMSEEYVETKNCHMVENNTDNHETAFTVSIDHITTTTGISAVERSIAALACVKEDAQNQKISKTRTYVSIKSKEKWSIRKKRTYRGNG